MQGKLEIDDMRQEIEELQDQYPNLNDDELFVFWFLVAYLTDDEHSAIQALCGGSDDMSVDAVFIDDAAQSVFIVQGKYRQQLNKRSETKPDIQAFASLADLITTNKETDFDLLIEDVDPSTAKRLRECRSRVLKRKYKLWLYFVTLGKCSQGLIKLARNIVRKAKYPSQIEILTGSRMMIVLRDYLDGVAPPILAVDLEMESGSGVKVNGIHQRYDGRTKIESWVFSMKGSDVGALFKRYGSRIFARNIRGYLGRSTPVNKAMKVTLKEEPERFFYYNNGITILCDNAERKSRKGRDLLHVENPQIINGQQTTRSLAEDQVSNKASVLVRVIQVPRIGDTSLDGFNELVSQIVSGTNWQNAIGAADLMSNDHKQIVLERELRKLGYLYVRKRQSKAEAKLRAGSWQFRHITKEQLAQAVAGCDLDPSIVRSGRDNLFKEELYPQVFPNVDPDFFLPRFWLMKAVTLEAKGYPERGYLKWLVLNFMWQRVAQILTTKKRKRYFHQAYYRKAAGFEKPLAKAIDKAFVAGRRFYRNNRGKGAKAEDISRFFRNRRNLHKQFGEFWERPDNTSKKHFETYLKRVEREISGN